MTANRSEETSEDQRHSGSPRWGLRDPSQYEYVDLDPEKDQFKRPYQRQPIARTRAEVMASPSLPLLPDDEQQARQHARPKHAKPWSKSGSQISQDCQAVVGEYTMTRGENMRPTVQQHPSIREVCDRNLVHFEYVVTASDGATVLLDEIDAYEDLIRAAERAQAAWQEFAAKPSVDTALAADSARASFMLTWSKNFDYSVLFPQVSDDLQAVRGEKGGSIVGVSDAARVYGETTRRVRQLASEGRFAGSYRDGQGIWRIPLVAVLAAKWNVPIVVVHRGSDEAGEAA